MSRLNYFVMVVSIVFFIWQAPISAQKYHYRKAQTYYMQNAFSRAIPHYKKVLHKGDTTSEVKTRLADAYFYALHSDSAKNYYEAAIADTAIGAEEMYRYIQVLRSAGNNEKAEYTMAQFATIFPNDERAINFNLQIAQIESPYKDKYVELENLPINTVASEYGAFNYGREFIFVSNRKTLKNNEAWTGNSYATIFRAAKKDRINKFPIDTKKNFIDDACIISANGKYLYLTRCEVTNRGLINRKQIYSTLKIYRYKKRRGKWIDKISLPINSTLYNVAHPAIDANGNYLYFVSDMVGGFGKSDIYRCKLTENGLTESPENLGATINTSGRETYISVDSKNRLYFASDGYWGNGGLDIYMVDLNQKKPKVENMGVPVNSAADDFAYHLSNDGTGYLSSNRTGGKGSDDIYKVLVRDIKYYAIKGKVMSWHNQTAIKNANVTLVDNNGTVSDTILSDENGHFYFDKIKYLYQLNKSLTTYKLNVLVPGYELFSQIIDIPTNKTLSVLDVMMKPVDNDINEFVDSEKAVSYVHFETAKYDISETYFNILNKVVSLCQNNASVNILISGHTDSRGSYQYNQKLSENRAMSVAKWFVTKGINERCLKVEGHSYAEPIAPNNTVEGMEKNRRVELHLVNNRK